MNKIDISGLADKIQGELHTDELHQIIYATDASVYRELPLGVVYPRNEQDVQVIVKYCADHKIPIIPRAGGTSLAGQCVGIGLVVDVSKFMNAIISVDPKLKTATVQPGVIRDELNAHLRSYGLMVGPNTSTANRATIGGMVGNNSCGSTSIVFGTTRDHVRSMRTVMSDGSLCTFGSVELEDLGRLSDGSSLESQVYQYARRLIEDESLHSLIRDEFPKSSIRRRNTGYAIDELLASTPSFNMCQLLSGSEGTLAMTTEVTIGLVDVPPPYEALVAIHFATVDDAMKAVPSIMRHHPFACELMDKTILDCTKSQPMYKADRFFLEGDPLAVMLVSFVGDSMAAAIDYTENLVQGLQEGSHGYSYPIITENINRIWNLRKAGLGLLANLPGDKKAVACIEDTAVAIEDLSAYIKEFSEIMASYGQRSVYYAHAGAGEIHLRPILDLKQTEDRQLFYDISLASARLVKKYDGSLSGEHGDGRVRAPFIKEMYGQEIYKIFQELKAIWDPHQIMNPGKIVDAPPMNHYLRFDDDHQERSYDTMFDFGAVGGVLRAAEKCNGSGDCRKLPVSGGTMCPSYMATRNEKDTTRARANTLREVLTRPKSDNVWDSQPLKEVMDLCLSCKGCSSECPSNVDMSAMKAEFLHQYHQKNGVPLRSRVFANFNRMSAFGAAFGGLSNFALSNALTGPLIKKTLGVHPKRSFPKLSNQTLRKRFAKIKSGVSTTPIRSLYLFCDEFTNYNDPEVGETAIKLLHALGYEVRMIDHPESGRAAISKGVLNKAKRLANQNVEIFSRLITSDVPLVGIEPSTILSFRDEYPRLVDQEWVESAKLLASQTFTIEEFLYQEVQSGRISADRFDARPRKIKLHGHCHQKALTDISKVAMLLGLPSGNVVDLIPSGCCGMAGSFGYEQEHYDISMQIGELVLLPAVRDAKPTTLIAASGTSCRHQIKDGADRKSYHPIEIMYQCLK